jgi:Family of unknown function (DUF6152)/Putative esterase
MRCAREGMPRLEDRMLTVRTMLALATVSGLAIAQTESPAKDFTSASLYQRVKVHGKSLEGNLSKEPADRDVSVYLPPSYSKDPTRRYPVVYLLHGYTNSDIGWFGPESRGSFANGVNLDTRRSLGYSAGHVGTRMKLTKRVLLFVAGIAVGAGPALGHHSLSEQFDLMQSIMLTGTVTKVDWSNPHVRLYLDTNGSGASEVMHWELLMSSPNQLILHGIKFDKLRRGDRITVTAHPARDGSNWGYAQKINLAK